MSDTAASAAAITAMALVIAACIAVAASILTSREQLPAVLRARWAWRCRGHPPLPERDRDPLEGDERHAFLAIVEDWHHPAPERSRT
jgi:hypothetical protein